MFLGSLLSVGSWDILFLQPWLIPASPNSPPLVLGWTESPMLQRQMRRLVSGPWTRAPFEVLWKRGEGFRWTHLRPAIWQACVYHTWRDSFLWQPSLAHLLIPSRPSIPTPFFLSGKHGTNSLQNNESAPQGNVQVRKAFKKKKSQGLCISRPAAEPPEGRAGDRSRSPQPWPKPPSYRLSLVLSSHNPKQASPHLRDCTPVIFRKREVQSPSWHFYELTEIIHWLTEPKEMI